MISKQETESRSTETPGKSGRRRHLREIPILPSMLTLGNLFCGFLSMAYTTDALSRLAAADEAGAVARIGQAGSIIFLMDNPDYSAGGWILIVGQSP